MMFATYVPILLNLCVYIYQREREGEREGGVG